MSLLQYRLVAEEKELQKKFDCKLSLQEKYEMEIYFHSTPLSILFHIPFSYPISMPHIYLKIRNEDYLQRVNDCCKNIGLNEDIERYIYSYVYEENKTYELHEWILENKQNEKIVEWYQWYQKYFRQGYTHRINLINIMKRINELVEIAHL
jgi:hypothetical protein